MNFLNVFLAGHFAAQIRLIFQPLFTDKGRPNEFLAYVQPLKPAPGTTEVRDGRRQHKPDANNGLYRVQRELIRRRRRGLIVKLTDIWRPIDLIPKFGRRCPEDWTTVNSVELAEEFFVNPYSDKETYAALFNSV